jgi:hypothetical protein
MQICWSGSALQTRANGEQLIFYQQQLGQQQILTNNN